MAAVSFAPSNPPQSSQPSTQHSQKQSGAASPNETIRVQFLDQIKQGGLTDVSVAPDSLIVHASDRRGDPVATIIDRNAMTAVTPRRVAPSIYGTRNVNGDNQHGVDLRAERRRRRNKRKRNKKNLVEV